MFDSGYPAEKLIEEVEKETNLAFPVTRESYASWLNLCEQGLYSDIIREEKAEEVPFAQGIDVRELSCDGFVDMARPDDIRSVFLTLDGKTEEVEKLSLENYLRGFGTGFVYACEGNRFVFRRSDERTDGTLTFIRTIRPIPKRVIGDAVTGTIMLPEEYLELMRCRLRGEKYRLMNEDVMCGKWISEYNYHLQMFTAFIEARRARL